MDILKFKRDQYDARKQQQQREEDEDRGEHT